jgi:hypothetical protein
LSLTLGRPHIEDVSKFLRITFDHKRKKVQRRTNLNEELHNLYPSPSGDRIKDAVGWDGHEGGEKCIQNFGEEKIQLG